MDPRRNVRYWHFAELHCTCPLSVKCGPTELGSHEITVHGGQQGGQNKPGQGGQQQGGQNKPGQQGGQQR